MPTSDLSRRRQDEINSINTWTAPKCCSKVCGDVIGTERCRRLRKQFLRFNRDKRKSLLLQFILDEPPNYPIEIDGYSPCWVFLNMAFDISNTLVTNCRRLRSANASHIPGRMGGVSSSESKASQVMSFLTFLANAIADEIPNSSERHLPHSSKKIVYGLYIEHCLSIGNEPCKPAYFYRIWSTYRSGIKCRRSHGFSVCDTCLMYKERLESLSNIASLSSNERVRVRNGFSSHLKYVRNERAAYSYNKLRPLDQNERAISVIIDCADQKNYCLPRFPINSKRETGIAIKQKVAEALFHNAVSGRDFLCFFTVPQNVRGGGNLTVEVLSRGLFALQEAHQDDGHISNYENLYIQLDNTVKDNKNRYVFSFCDYLIATGVFKSITVSFLPVGHTHEDVDRRFSYISHYLKNQNISLCSLEDLHEALRKSQQSTKVHVGRIKALHNFSGALEQQSCVQGVEGFLLYYKLVFKRDNEHSSNIFKVSCRGFLSMSAPEVNGVEIPRGQDSLGCFLRHLPDMRGAPLLPYKTIPAEELKAMRERVQKTELRINNLSKVLSLTKEIQWLEEPPQPTPEWAFEKLESLKATQEEMSSDLGDLELLLSEPSLSYKVGDMVAVNCGRESTTLTPFWLGKIVDYESSLTSSEVQLEVQWYEVSASSSQHANLTSYKGKYTPMTTIANMPFTNRIPSSSVLVTFSKLTLRGTIPSDTQTLIKECVDQL